MKDAKRYDVGVGKGDVVVLGSDGLMDNLVGLVFLTSKDVDGAVALFH